MELFKLFGTILIPSDEAQKSLSSVDKKAEGLGTRLMSGIKTAAKFGAALVAGAAVAVSAMIGLATKAGAAADRLLDLNSITGMSTDEIQRWQKAAVIAGTSTEAMTNASQKLTKSLDTITKSGGKGAEALEALGLSVNQVAGMNADERMNAITEALAGIEDKSERARIGTNLLGGSWAEVAPIIDLGAEAMQRAKDSANIINNEDLVRANAFRERMDEMKDTAGHFALMLGVSVLPILELFFDGMAKHMPAIQRIFTAAFTVISTAIQTGVEWIGVFIGWIQTWLSENETTTKEISKLFVELFSAVKGVIEVFVGWATAFWEVWGETITGLFKTVFGIITNVWKTNLAIITDLLRIFSALFRGDWQALWEAVKSLVLNVWDGIVAGIKGAINLIIISVNGMINAVVSGINAVAELINNIPGVNIPVGFEPPKIPLLAEGGTITRRGWAMVGEQGPELLNLNAGAQVRPLDKAGGVTFERGAFEGLFLLDDYGVDRLMDRIFARMAAAGMVI